MDNHISRTQGNLEYLPGQQKVSVSADMEDDTLVSIRTPEDVINNFSQMMGDISEEYLNISRNKINRAADIQAKHFALLRAGVNGADGVKPDNIEMMYEGHIEEASNFITECRQLVARGQGMPSSVASISQILGNRALDLISASKKDGMLIAQAAARMALIADYLSVYFHKDVALDDAIDDIPVISDLGAEIYNIPLAITLPQFSHVGRFSEESGSVAAAQAAHHLCYIFIAILRDAEKKNLWHLYDKAWQDGSYQQLYTDAIRAGAHFFFGEARKAFMNCPDKADQAIIDLEAVQENINRMLDISVPTGHKIPDFNVLIDVIEKTDMPQQCAYVVEERARQLVSI